MINVTRIAPDAGVDLKWKVPCDPCAGISTVCLEVDFRTKIDYVCLTLSTECVWKGRFLNDPTASEVVATRGCPDEEAGVTEVSFKCNDLNTFLYVIAADGTTKKFTRNHDLVDEIVPEPTNLIR